MISTEYDIERMNIDKLKDFLFLFEKSFKRKVDINYYVNKYDTAKFLHTYVGYMAYTKNGIPAAYYGVLPIPLVYGGKEYLAAQSGDTMTHPNHRGKGLFIRLANMTYQLARSLNIKLIFGFPNKYSYPGFVKRLNWTHNEDLIIYSIKVKTFPASFISKKSFKLGTIYNYYVSNIIKRFIIEQNHINNMISEEGFGGVIRDNRFFSYKKYSNKYFLEIDNSKMWVKVDGGLLVGDVDISQGIDIARIIKELRKIATMLGCHKIQFGFSPGVYFERQLSKSIGVSGSMPIGCLDLDSGLPMKKIKFTLADADFF